VLPGAGVGHGKLSVLALAAATTLSLAGQLIAVVLVGAFLVTQFGGGDSTPYAWVGAVFAVGYLGGLLWYRNRS
jgi:hypothetical protein